MTSTSIKNGRIVYSTIAQDHEDATYVDVYNIVNSTKTRVTQTPLNYTLGFDISGDKVVYDNYDYTNDVDRTNGEIYMYDLSTGNTIPITNKPGTQYLPVIDGDMIAWLDMPVSGNRSDVYVAKLIYPRTTTADISPLPISQDFASNRYLGNADVNPLASEAITPPVFINLPGTDMIINITGGQTITTNPYVIKVRPDDNNGISKVEFYVDNILICTSTTPDIDGVYSCNWDTSKYHSDIKVIAYDKDDTPSIALLRTTSVKLPEAKNNDQPNYSLYLVGMVVITVGGYLLFAIVRSKK